MITNNKNNNKETYKPDRITEDGFMSDCSTGAMIKSSNSTKCKHLCTETEWEQVDVAQAGSNQIEQKTDSVKIYARNRTKYKMNIVPKQRHIYKILYN